MATVLSADWPVTPVTSVQQHQLSSDSRRHAVALARCRCDLSLTVRCRVGFTVRLTA